MNPRDQARDLRWSTTFRGVLITIGVAAYAKFTGGRGPSAASMFLVGAALQLAVICARRFVPPDQLPMATYYLEMIADGITILLFALGFYGGLAQMAAEV